MDWPQIVVSDPQHIKGFRMNDAVSIALCCEWEGGGVCCCLWKDADRLCGTLVCEDVDLLLKQQIVTSWRRSGGHVNEVTPSMRWVKDNVMPLARLCA